MSKRASRLRLTLAAGMAVAAVCLEAQAPTPPTAAPLPLLIDVQVIRDGKPAEGLSASDFVLLDSGVAQATTLVTAAAAPLNLLLVLETTAGLRGAALGHVKDAARAAVGALRPADQGGLVTFSHRIHLVPWTTSREDLNAAVDAMAAEGSSALTDAAFAALVLRPRPASRTLVLFFVASDDAASWVSASEVVRVARRSDAVVSTVMLAEPGHSGASISGAFSAASDKSGGAGRAQVAQWLIEEPSLYRGALLPILAVETGGDSAQVAETSNLAAAFADVVSRHIRRYVLSYTPTGVPAGGWHPLQVDVKGGGHVIARSGYLR